MNFLNDYFYPIGLAVAVVLLGFLTLLIASIYLKITPNQKGQGVKDGLESQGTKDRLDILIGSYSEINDGQTLVANTLREILEALGRLEERSEAISHAPASQVNGGNGDNLDFLQRPPAVILAREEAEESGPTETEDLTEAEINEIAAEIRARRKKKAEEEHALAEELEEAEIDKIAEEESGKDAEVPPSVARVIAEHKKELAAEAARAKNNKPPASKKPEAPTIKPEAPVKTGRSNPATDPNWPRDAKGHPLKKGAK